MPKFGQYWLCFVLCDLELWQMTFKNNRAHLLCHIKPCTSFRHHIWIQTGVTVRKQANLGFDLCGLDLWPLTLTFCMDITFVNSNHSWKFHNNTMRVTLSKRSDRRIEPFIELLGHSSKLYSLDVVPNDLIYRQHWYQEITWHQPDITWTNDNQVLWCYNMSTGLKVLVSKRYQ